MDSLAPACSALRAFASGKWNSQFLPNVSPCVNSRWRGPQTFRHFPKRLKSVKKTSPGYGAASRDVRLYFPPTTLIWSGDSKMISGRLRYSVILPVISTF